MTARYDIALLKTRLDGIRTEENPALVKQKSRDFFWYSPILKRQLDHVVADIIVSPTSEAEVVQVLAACHELGIPVTPRGTGTGNYGQAMPLSGGVLLDLS
uniref:FAD-binding oxidoreductase n=1 Tax=Bosea sp. ASV33 TaxID=2795106 RepID=UPI0018EE27A0